MHSIPVAAPVPQVQPTSAAPMATITASLFSALDGVVDEDGAVHIPDDLAARFPAGMLVQFETTPDGLLLRPVDEGDRG